MEEGEPIVSLNVYWSSIALPLFLFVMSFGIFVLFKIGGSQTAETPTVLSTIAKLKDTPTFFRQREARARRSAPPLPSAPAAKVA